MTCSIKMTYLAPPSSLDSTMDRTRHKEHTLAMMIIPGPISTFPDVEDIILENSK